MVMKSIIKISSLFLIFSLYACRKYLAANPDKSIVTITSISDCQALLDNATYLNLSYPELLSLATDDYYLNSSDYNSLSQKTDQQNYLWDPNGFDEGAWDFPYRVIYYSNVVLDNLSNVENGKPSEINTIKGFSLFYRGLAEFTLSQLYCKPYDITTSASDPGIVLRLDPDFNKPSSRASVENTYRQVISDLKSAGSLLPIRVSPLTRPDQRAAYGLLSRVYLAMGFYDSAKTYSNYFLTIQSSLMDFNSIDLSSVPPIHSFNLEVAFHAELYQSDILYSPTAKVDSNLFSLYDSNDLRKSIFFIPNGDGSFSFQGSYSGDNYIDIPFYGIATDEIYLNRAESYARLQKPDSALQDLNTLLKKRYKTGSFQPLANLNGDTLLSKILQERRKELCYRGIRWSDLRRLNIDPRFAVTLSRNINGIAYTLPPGDLRYTMLIPPAVIIQNGISQNPR
jgi:hypothetical protein